MSPATSDQVRVSGKFRSDIAVAVVIPTYNEAENIEGIVDQLFATRINDLGILFVDDSSPDGTGEIADRLVEQYPTSVVVAHRAGKLGLGTAYIEGFNIALNAGIDKIVQMDCDLSHPPSELPGIVARLEHADVAVGTRYSHGGNVDPNWRMSRVLLSKWANFGIRAILGLKVHDATGGFKAFRSSALRAIELDRLTITGFGFQAEVAYRVQRCGLTVSEHPYVFMERTAGKSKMSLNIALEAFWRLTMLRFGRR